MKARTKLIDIICKYNENWTEIYTAVAKSETVKHIKNTDTWITLMDEEYPTAAKYVLRPPFGLRYTLLPKGQSFTKELKKFENSVYVLTDTTILSVINYPHMYITYSSEYEWYYLLCSESNMFFYSKSKEELTKFAMAICKAVLLVYNKEIPEEDIVNLEMYGLAIGKEIFVRPTAYPSKGNDLIVAGAHLYDCDNRIKEVLEK